MCLAVFIASDRDLPLIAQTSPPSFSVEELAERSRAITAHFPAGWCVRYAGSSSGCGCDFSGRDSASSRAALRSFLIALPPMTQVQLYACWEGDETVPTEERIATTPDELVTTDAIFSEGRLITLVSR